MITDQSIFGYDSEFFSIEPSVEAKQMSTLMAQEGMRVPGEAPPQEAANGPASGVIGGENATPAETVADDIPMDVPEGSFIINAAAAEVAGYGDIKTMIMDAIGVARRLGVEISTGDEQVGDEEAVDLLVSKGEVYIEPTLAKIIGYDVLEKINNRGKREVARRQKEAEAKQQQEPQQAPEAPKEVVQEAPQMAKDGGFLKKKFADGGLTEEEAKEARKNHPSSSPLTSYLNFSKINDDVIFPLMSLYMNQPNKPMSDMFSFGVKETDPLRKSLKRGVYNYEDDVVKLVRDPVASDFDVDPKSQEYIANNSSKPFFTRLNEDFTAAHEMIHGALARPVGFLENEVGATFKRNSIEHRIIHYLMPKALLDNKKLWIEQYGEEDYRHQLANEVNFLSDKVDSEAMHKRLRRALFKDSEDGKGYKLKPPTDQLERALEIALQQYEKKYEGTRSDLDNFIKELDFEKIREMTGTEQSKETVYGRRQTPTVDNDVDAAAKRISGIIQNKNSGGFAGRANGSPKGGETKQEFPDYIKKYFMPEIDYHLETIRSKTVARNQYGQPTTAYTSGVRRGDKIYEIPTYDRKGGILSRAEVEASLDNYIEKYGDFGIPQSKYNTLMREKEAYKQELYSKDDRFKVPEDAITQKIVLPEEEQQDSRGFIPKK